MTEKLKNKISTTVAVPIEFAHRFCRTPFYTRMWLPFVGGEMIQDGHIGDIDITKMEKSQFVPRVYQNYSKDNPDNITRYFVKIYSDIITFQNVKNSYVCEYHFEAKDNNAATKITYIEYNSDGTPIPKEDLFTPSLLQRNLKKQIMTAYSQYQTMEKLFPGCLKQIEYGA